MQLLRNLMGYSNAYNNLGNYDNSQTPSPGGYVAPPNNDWQTNNNPLESYGITDWNTLKQMGMDDQSMNNALGGYNLNDLLTGWLNNMDTQRLADFKANDNNPTPTGYKVF